MNFTKKNYFLNFFKFLKINKFAGFFCTSCILIISCCINVFAQTSGNFYVSAVIPENQADNRQTYFDLYMEPNQKQTLEVIITNTKSEEITIIPELNSASTGRNGLIVYTDPDIRDENLKVSVTDIAELRDDVITIPSHSTFSAYIDINMPDERVYGTILGGITFTEEDAENDENEPDSGVLIKNRVTYVIGLKISESEDTVAPGFELLSITPGLINYKTAVSVRIRNTEPLIVKNMKVDAEIFSDETASGASESIQKLSLENSEMAPISGGDFIIDWENKEFTSGAYRLEMTISYNEREWSWSERFDIEDNEASEINSGAVDINPNEILKEAPNHMLWIYIITGIAVITVIIYIGSLTGKRKQRS